MLRVLREARITNFRFDGLERKNVILFERFQYLLNILYRFTLAAIIPITMRENRIYY